MSGKIIIVRADDWQGIYVSGYLHWEHHDIDEYGWVRLHNQYAGERWSACSFNSHGLEWLDNEGCLPNYFSDIPKNYYKWDQTS